MTKKIAAKRIGIDTTVDGAAVARQTICLMLERGGFCNDRKGAISLVDTGNAEKDRLRLRKILVPPELFDRVNAVDYAFNDDLDIHVLPSMFRRGVYSVSIAAFNKVERMLTRYIEDRAHAAHEFAHVLYPPERANARTVLGDQWKASDYPEPSVVEAKFYVRYRWFETNVPLTLKSANPEVYHAETRKLQESVQRAAEEMRQFMRVTFAEFVAALREKMTDTADGKKRRFHESLLTKWNDFVRTFPLRDVTDDKALATLVQDVHKLLKGVDATTMRDDDAVRASIRSSMTTIGRAVEPLLTVHRRAIDMDEEGVA